MQIGFSKQGYFGGAIPAGCLCTVGKRHQITADTAAVIDSFLVLHKTRGLVGCNPAVRRLLERQICEEL
jgi:hypothetical protein